MHDFMQHWSLAPRFHAAGRSAFEAIPVSSDACYSNAVDSLQLHCGKRLDEDTRSRLAIHLTNCHLSASNLSTYACPSSTPVAECTRPMVDSPSSIAFNVYTSFVTHADSLCFFLRSSAFEQRAETAVSTLYTSSRDATAKLAAISEHASSVHKATAAIRDGQLEVAASTAALLTGQRLASSELHLLQTRQAASFISAEEHIGQLASASGEAIGDLLRHGEDIRLKTEAVEQLLDKVLYIARYTASELSGLATLALYTVVVLLAIAATARFSPLAAARLPCLGVVVGTAGLERLLTRIVSGVLAQEAEVCWQWRWRLRRLAGCVVFAIMLSVLLSPRPARRTPDVALRRRATAKNTISAALRARQRRQQAHQPSTPLPSSPQDKCAEVSESAPSEIADAPPKGEVGETAQEPFRAEPSPHETLPLPLPPPVLCVSKLEAIGPVDGGLSAPMSLDLMIPPPPSPIGLIRESPIGESPIRESLGAKTTRSGRLSLAPQAYWAGQCIERLSDGSYAQLSDGSPRRRGRTQGGAAMGDHADLGCIDVCRAPARRRLSASSRARVAGCS